MKTVNCYFNYANKTSAGHIDIADDDDIEKLVQKWMKDGYCKIRFSGTRQWIFVNWQAIVYASYNHQHIDDGAP